MINAQKNEINAKKIGYMSYNKLNVFMTTLLLGFSITFAILGDRVNISNIFTSMGDWDWSNIGIIFVIILFIILVPYAAGIICFKLGLCYELGLKIKNNPIIIAAIISIFSILGIGHLLLSFKYALSLDGILLLGLPLYIGYKNLTEIHQILAALISIISIGGIGHLLFPLLGALILDVILVLVLLLGLLYIGYKNLTEIHQITLPFISLSALLIGLLGVLGILLSNYIQNKVTKEITESV